MSLTKKDLKELANIRNEYCDKMRAFEKRTGAVLCNDSTRHEIQFYTGLSKLKEINKEPFSSKSDLAWIRFGGIRFIEPVDK